MDVYFDALDESLRKGKLGKKGKGSSAGWLGVDEENDFSDDEGSFKTSSSEDKDGQFQANRR